MGCWGKRLKWILNIYILEIIKLPIFKIIHNTLFKKVIFYTIILNLIALVIELESNLDNRFVVFLENFELLSIVIFSIEYVLRVLETKKPVR